MSAEQQILQLAAGSGAEPHHKHIDKLLSK